MNKDTVIHHQRSQQNGGSTSPTPPSTRNSSGSIEGRDAFIANIASRLGRYTPTRPPERDVIGVPEFYAERKLDQETKIEQFCQSLTVIGGKAFVIDSSAGADEIWEILKQTIEAEGVTRVARWDNPLLEQLDLDSRMDAVAVKVVPWRRITDEAAADMLADAPRPGRDGPNWSLREPHMRAVEACQLGIVTADYAISGTGSIALVGLGGQGRSVSLVVDIIFAIIPAERLVTRMGELFADYKALHGVHELPSTLNFVTGPSRSADIENDLTIGVHGPGKVVAVVVK